MICKADKGVLLPGVAQFGSEQLDLRSFVSASLSRSSISVSRAVLTFPPPELHETVAGERLRHLVLRRSLERPTWCWYNMRPNWASARFDLLLVLPIDSKIASWVVISWKVVTVLERQVLAVPSCTGPTGSEDH